MNSPAWPPSSNPPPSTAGLEHLDPSPCPGPLPSLGALTSPFSLGAKAPPLTTLPPVAAPPAAFSESPVTSAENPHLPPHRLLLYTPPSNPVDPPPALGAMAAHAPVAPELPGAGGHAARPLPSLMANPSSTLLTLGHAPNFFPLSSSTADHAQPQPPAFPITPQPPLSPSVAREVEAASRASALAVAEAGAAAVAALGPPADAPSTDLPVKAPRRAKRYSSKTPSKYCHVCQRKAAAVEHLVCGNIQRYLCRKVVCEVCFEDNGWSWADAKLKDAAQRNGESVRFECSHCLKSCPDRAQCKIYTKINSRRKTRADLKREQEQAEETERKVQRSLNRTASYQTPQINDPTTRKETNYAAKHTGPLPPSATNRQAESNSVPGNLAVSASPFMVAGARSVSRRL